MKILSIIILMCSNFVECVHAFNMDPYSKIDASSEMYRKRIFPPIHENLTLAALKKAKNEYPSLNIKSIDLIYGVRWNDDPMQFAKFHPVDFYIYYKDSCGRPERIDPTWDLLYRTHCGDLQFLHAMASTEKEPAKETLEKMLMWAEFTYKVSTGSIDHNYRFEKLGDLLKTENAPRHFKYLLTNNGTTRIDWQPEDLFTLECDRDFSVSRWASSLFSSSRPTELKCKKFSNDHDKNMIQNRALGSLLHLIQDSFSDSHVSRFPIYSEKESRITNREKIREFHIYTKQNEKEHSKADFDYSENEDNGAHGLNLLTLSSDIIRMSYDDRENRKCSWPEVEKMLRSAFDLSDLNALPTGGKYK